MKELFDFNFNSFITPKIVKIVYILIIIGLGLTYLTFVIAAFASREALLGFFIMVIIGPLMVLIYLALARMGLESLVSAIRTAENTRELVRLSGGNAPDATPPAGGSYPGGPQAPPANPYGNYPQA